VLGLQEVPDIVTVDSEDNVLVVECTLNMPNTEQKLAKLLRRREFISNGFRDRNLANTHVVAVLAVAQSAGVLGPFQGEIDKHHVIAWNKHDLDALAALDGPPNSSAIYRDLLYRVAALDAQWPDVDDSLLPN
jgi:hypothetical protein